MLQLKIALNHELSDLGLGTGWDNFGDLKRWGVIRSGIKGISSSVMKLVIHNKLSKVSIQRRSIFGSNMHRALRTVLGSTDPILSDAVSLSGYSFDFELLLDGDGNPITIPIRWKYKSDDAIRASVGLGGARKLRTSASDMKHVIDSLKEKEDDVSSHKKFDRMTISKSNYFKRSSVNLASDWGNKFENIPCIAQKIVLEADGPYHYVQNCNRSMGFSMLKARHIRNMGWKLIVVSF